MVSSSLHKGKGAIPVFLLIIAVVLVISGAGFYYEYSKKLAQPASSVQSTPSPIASPSISPSPSQSPSPTPTPKPVVKSPPSIKPSPSPSQATDSQSGGIYADPAGISITKKKSELKDLPTFKIYYPGTHKVFVMPDNGRLGIYAQFQGDGQGAFGEIHDSVTLQLGFSDAYGSELKTGVNKLNLQVKPGDDIVSAANSGSVLNIPIEVNIIE